MFDRPLRGIESLKKEAKRWLAALRSGNAAARARFERAVPNAPTNPTLRDVQHALAREHGFDGWRALVAAATLGAPDRSRAAGALATYEAAVDALLEAYRTGTPEAMERHYRHTWHRRVWSAMRTYVQLDLGKRPSAPDEDVEITRDDARHLVAVDHGFANWDALRAFTQSPPTGRRLVARPMLLVHAKPLEDEEVIANSRDWDEILELLAAHPSAALGANGQMTDELLGELARVESLEGLNLAGSPVTDGGLGRLAGLPHLKHLALGGTAITDRGLDVLRHLPALEALSLAGTRTGDAALRALAGAPGLSHFVSGTQLTDAGLALLHELPVFKTWQGGEPKYALTSYRALPNQLTLRGRITDRGMEHLRGLDGLFGLNLDDRNLAITAAGLPPLVTLPNLGWLAVDARDDWMPLIAAMPKLRFLGAQDTVAGDEGFVALSASQSLEYIWGRRCHNLRTRGFAALSRMPKLRALSVSCLNVDDAGVAALPDFPALRELMPMDVPDAGYRHIGKCQRLEHLVLMYCRDTTDAATEHITGLSNLTYYFNSYTTITDRTPALLSTMPSLERVTFDACHNLTNAGVAALARLPRLRELRVAGRGLTPDVAAAFPASVRVHVGG